MIAARFIIIHEETGEVLNAFVVESASEWPPPAVGTITKVDSLKQYNIGDIVPNPISQQFDRLKDN